MIGGSPVDVAYSLVLVSPSFSLVWEPCRCSGLCLEHVCQTRLSFGAPRAAWLSSSSGRRVVMDVIVERPAGLDVHKAQVTACVRLPGPGRERVQEVAQFTTTVAGLLTLR